MLQSSLQVKWKKIDSNKLFSAAEENRWYASGFHDACDNKGPLIILYTVKETGRRGGAVTFKTWFKNSFWNIDPLAFLFSLDEMMRFQVKDPKKTFLVEDDYGIRFGAYDDLLIGYKAPMNHQGCFSLPN